MTRHLDACSILAGAEPKFTTVLTKEQLINTLNWYNQNKTTKDADVYVHQFFKKIQKTEINAEAYKEVPSNFGFLCRIVYNGGTLPSNNQVWFDSILDKLKNKKNTKKVKKQDDAEPEPPKENIQTRIAEKCSQIIGELEGMVDDLILSKFKTQQAPKAIMHDVVKNIHTKTIIEWSKKKRQEFAEILSTEDKQLIEGYSCYKKIEIKKIVAFYDSVITECMSITESSMKTRKPRKRKIKTPEQLVSSVKICLEYDELKLKSISPKDIIGSTQLWVYNKKYRKLGVYHANDSQGFSVKGTTITNYDENKSICKTVRKPNEVLPEVLKGGKIYLRNVLEKINAVDGKLNGRLNEDVVLLRIVK